MNEETVTTTAAAPDESGSLADHESAYRASVEGTPAPAEPAAKTAKTTPPAAAASTDDESAATEPAERDERGQFKPRHRAKSQDASPDDVPRIRELTRRLREAEAERDALKSGKPADATRATTVQPPPAIAPASAGFPSFEQWAAIKENDGKTFEDFIDARTAHNYRVLRAAEREEETRQSAERAYQKIVDDYAKQIPAVVKKYPDFDDVVSPGGVDIQVSKVLERAVIEVGPEVAYYLGLHADERDALTDETLLDAAGKALDPSHPAFAATVAGVKRYLRTLVASEQRSSSSSRPAAASTGSALTLAPPPAPRPPNPVRTGALRDADAPPTDESSLADHERAFGPKRHRA